MDIQQLQSQIMSIFLQSFRISMGFSPQIPTPTTPTPVAEEPDDPVVIEPETPPTAGVVKPPEEEDDPITPPMCGVVRPPKPTPVEPGELGSPEYLAGLMDCKIDASLYDIEYDNKGRVISMTYKGDKKKNYTNYGEITYLDNGGVKIKRTEVHYGCNCVTMPEWLTYNKDGKLIETEKGGVKSTYTYNKDGSYDVSAVDTSSGKVKYTQKFGSNGKLVAQTQYYDNGKPQLSQEYGANGAVTAETQYYDNGNPKLSKTFGENGKLSAETEYFENGKPKVSKKYDSSGKVIAETQYYDNGNPKISQEYGKSGAVTAETQYSETGKPTLSRKFDDNGRLTAETQYYASGKPKISQEFNAKGKVIAETEYYENGNPKVSRTFDDDGNLTAETKYNEDGTVVEPADPNTFEIARLFEILGGAKGTASDLLSLSDRGSQASGGRTGNDNQYLISKADLAKAFKKYSADTSEGKLIRMFYDGSNTTELFNNLAKIGHAWGGQSDSYLDFGEIVDGLGINRKNVNKETISLDKLKEKFDAAEASSKNFGIAELFEVLGGAKGTASDLLSLSDRGSQASGGNPGKDNQYLISKADLAAAFKKYPADSKQGKLIRMFFDGTNTTELFNNLAKIGHAWGGKSNDYLDFGEIVDGLGINRKNVNNEKISLDKLQEKFDAAEANSKNFGMAELFEVLGGAKGTASDLLSLSDRGSQASGGSSGKDNSYLISKADLAAAFKKYSADSKQGKLIRMFYDGTNTTELFNKLAKIGYAWGGKSNDYLDFGEIIDGLGINRGNVNNEKISLDKLAEKLAEAEKQSNNYGIAELFEILGGAKGTASDLLSLSDRGSQASGGNPGKDNQYLISKADLAAAYKKYPANSKEGKLIRLFYDGSKTTDLFNNLAKIGHAWGGKSNDYLDFGEIVDGLGINRKNVNNESITYDKLLEKFESSQTVTPAKLFNILGGANSTASSLLRISDTGSQASGGNPGRDNQYLISKADLANAFKKYSADSFEGKLVRLFYDGTNTTALFNKLAKIGHAWGGKSNDYLDFGEIIDGLGINRSTVDKESISFAQLKAAFEKA